MAEIQEQEGQEQQEVIEQEGQEPRQEDESQAEYDRRIKGLETAAANERKKRQFAEQELDRIRRESEERREPQRDPPREQKEQPDFDTEFERRYAAKERQKRIDDWASTMTEAQARYESVDLNEALNEVGTTLGRFGQPGNEIADQIIGSDKSWDLLAHLHQNPEALQRLSRMGPIAAAAEIGRIESKLDGGPAPQVSKAPAPIKPNSSAARPDKNPDDMSLAEYEQYMKERRGGTVWPK